MSKTDYPQALKIARKQEEMLQFDRFNCRDAWDLGNLMVKEVFDRGIDLAICIRQLNGSVIFQYVTDNTSKNNQNWINRKFNTVSMMNCSSLCATIDARISGFDVPAHGLDPQQYTFCGGGFPIRVKGSGIVAVALVSWLPHVQDHAFIVDCLAKYLGVADVPVLDMEIEQL